MKATALQREPERAHRKTVHGDVICTDWVGSKKRRVRILHLQGPYIGADDADIDCTHWMEIVESLGGENLF